MITKDSSTSKFRFLDAPLEPSFIILALPIVDAIEKLVVIGRP
jgi:hypothetical protein